MAKQQCCLAARQSRAEKSFLAFCHHFVIMTKDTEQGVNSMTETEARLARSFDSIAHRIPFRPRVALVLGSGLGGFADRLAERSVIPYREIADFPVSTVAGHAGQFVFGTVDGVPVVAMQGRVHYYEGYSMEDVVLPVRLMRRMGAEILFLTNAAGGLNADFSAGDLMMITDQIACFVPSPLIGENPETLGPRFPDMTHIYDPELQQLLLDTAEDHGVGLKKGVYVQMSGPNYESPAEVRMAKLVGGDAVGMSTACEAVAANHCGFRICGISCITNLASGLSSQPLSHEEVKTAADEAAPRFQTLVWNAISKL